MPEISGVSQSKNVMLLDVGGREVASVLNVQSLIFYKRKLDLGTEAILS